MEEYPLAQATNYGPLLSHLLFLPLPTVVALWESVRSSIVSTQSIRIRNRILVCHTTSDPESILTS